MLFCVIKNSHYLCRMKYSLQILFFVFLCSCGLFKKSKQMHEGYGNGGNLHTDSITIDIDSIPSNDIYGESPEPDFPKVVITSGEIWYPKSPKKSGKENLKIITIENTKVISKSIEMSDGRVVYKIPPQMKIRSTYRVLLRIAKSKSILCIYDSLKGEVRTSEIPVTETMEIKLIDPSPMDNKSFEIVPDNNAVQIVENGDTYTEWSWNVTPIKIGNSNLKIVVSIIRDGNKKDIVYEDSVEVEKDIPTQILFFWNKYWQWIIATFLLPFIIFLYKNRKKKKEEEK